MKEQKVQIEPNPDQDKDNVSQADSDEKAEDIHSHNHGPKNNKKKEQTQHVHGQNCNHDHDKKKKGPAKKNLFLIVYPIFTISSCVYLQHFHFWSYYPNRFLRQYIPYINYTLLLLCMWSFYLTLVTPTTTQKMRKIPQYLKQPKPRDSAYDITNKMCDKCDYYKIPRTSHCSRCGDCVTKLDHHCIWIQRCVGYQIHRPFFLFILYQSIGYILYWHQCYWVIYQLYGSCHFWSTFPVYIYILWAVTTFTMSLLGTLIFLLTIFQAVLISTNYTTMDNYKNTHYCAIPFVQVRPAFNDSEHINLFDRGQIQNWKDFMGGNTIISFLIPTSAQMENDFIVDKITPPPSRAQIQTFSGEEGNQVIMAEELRRTVKSVKSIYKGKKFNVKGKIIEI